jgi:hypothetical protein
MRSLKKNFSKFSCERSSRFLSLCDFTLLVARVVQFDSIVLALHHLEPDSIGGT